MNNFRLTAGVSSVLRSKWSYYGAVVRLHYKNQAGKVVSAIVYTSDKEYRSRRKAEKDIPAILLDEQAYTNEVERGIRDLQNPDIVYKVMRVKDGSLRSLHQPNITYHPNELHAHPVIPDIRVGIYVSHAPDEAWRRAEYFIRHAPAGVFALVRCEAGGVRETGRGHMATALVPREIVEVRCQYNRRIKINTATGVAVEERFDEHKLKWTKAGNLPNYYTDEFVYEKPEEEEYVRETRYYYYSA